MNNRFKEKYTHALRYNYANLYNKVIDFWFVLPSIAQHVFKVICESLEWALNISFIIAIMPIMVPLGILYRLVYRPLNFALRATDNRMDEINESIKRERI